LFAEIRMRGMSDKRWNVLCQSAAIVAKFARGRTPKMAKRARLQADGLGWTGEGGGWIWLD
jgi:hypothetical protein